MIIDTLNENFACCVKLSRKHLGMSQQKLAETMTDRCGVKFYQQTIQKVENGKREVTVGEAFVIADVLGIKFGEL